MKTVVAMVLSVTLVMVLDYWWLNLQSLTLVDICQIILVAVELVLVRVVLVLVRVPLVLMRVEMVTSEGEVIVMVV